jgi:hypothetical protein
MGGRERIFNRGRRTAARLATGSSRPDGFMKGDVTSRRSSKSGNCLSQVVVFTELHPRSLQIGDYTRILNPATPDSANILGISSRFSATLDNSYLLRFKYDFVQRWFFFLLQTFFLFISQQVPSLIGAFMYFSPLLFHQTEPFETSTARLEGLGMLPLTARTPLPTPSLHSS